MNEIRFMREESKDTSLDLQRKNYVIDSYYSNMSQSIQQRYLLQKSFPQVTPLKDIADRLASHFSLANLKLELDNFNPICPCQFIVKQELGLYISDHIAASMAGIHPHATSMNLHILFDQDSDSLNQIERNLSDSTGNQSDVTEKVEISVKSEELCPKITSPQSKWKNCYCLILGRVVKSCKEYFRIMKRSHSFDELVLNSRLYYIHRRLLSESDPKSFQSYLQNYKNLEPKTKRKRGKNAMLQFLEEGEKNGVILAQLIQDFLTQENLDRHAYINDSRRPKSQIVGILCNPRDLSQLRDKFCEMEKIVEEKINDKFQRKKYES